MTTLPSRSEGPSRSARVGAIVLALLGAAGWLIILCVLALIVPRFAEIFKKFKFEVPVPTQVLCDLGLIVQKFWYAFGFGWLGVTAGTVLWVLRGRWKHRALVASILGGISVLVTTVILVAVVMRLFRPIVIQ
jgi:type II secretory pathway component PulF